MVNLLVKRSTILYIITDSSFGTSIFRHTAYFKLFHIKLKTSLACNIFQIIPYSYHNLSSKRCLFSFNGIEMYQAMPKNFIFVHIQVFKWYIYHALGLHLTQVIMGIQHLKSHQRLRLIKIIFYSTTGTISTS